MFENYLDLVCKEIQNIKKDEHEAIQQAGRLVADAIMQGHLVFTFGSGHSQLLALEVRGRAGGLYPIVEIMDPLRGKAEKLEGIGHILMQGARISAGDVLFNISNSGRNPEGIEIAIDAKSGRQDDRRHFPRNHQVRKIPPLGRQKPLRIRGCRPG